MSSTTKTTQDYLSQLSPEIHLAIISWILMKYFLDLSHTSRFFRNIPKKNACTICNEDIQRRHARIAAILHTKNSTVDTRWLVPDHNIIKQCKDYYKQFFRDMQPDPSLYQAFGLLDPVTPDHLQLSISAPGPQYLYLLESCLEGFLRKLENGVDFGVMPELEFLFFMRRFEYRLFSVENRVLTLAYPPGRFPRELVWYYGLDSVKIDDN